LSKFLKSVLSIEKLSDEDSVYLGITLTNIVGTNNIWDTKFDGVVKHFLCTSDIILLREGI